MDTANFQMPSEGRGLASNEISLLPLALVVVPLGREALNGVGPHVQHLLRLHGHPVMVKCMRDGAVHCGAK